MKTWAALLFAALMLAPAQARPPIDGGEVSLERTGELALAKFKRDEKGCGILRDGSGGTRLFDTFETSILKLDRTRILPLMVTDKPRGGELLNHKIRTPCIISLSRAASGWRLRVATRERTPRIEAELSLSREGKLIDVARNGIYFYVIGEYARGNPLKNRLDLLAQTIASFRCLPRERDQDCAYQFLNFAERAVSDELRYQSFQPAPGRTREHLRLDGEVMAAVKDPLKRAFHRLIVANESATISPYQIWDAALADSGLSFGPHQWDIGINPEAQRLFLRLVRGEFENPRRLFKSVRTFSARELHDMLTSAPTIDAILTKPMARRRILAAYVDWLDHGALASAQTRLPFLHAQIPEHQIMLLFYADVDNQYGSEPLKRDLRALMRRLADTYAGRLEIRATLDAQMLATPFARAHRDKALARLERTWAILGGL
jgi:hypothetical protein